MSKPTETDLAMFKRILGKRRASTRRFRWKYSMPIAVPKRGIARGPNWIVKWEPWVTLHHIPSRRRQPCECPLPGSYSEVRLVRTIKRRSGWWTRVYSDGSRVTLDSKAVVTVMCDEPKKSK